MRSINKNLRESLFRAYIERNKNTKNQKRFDVMFGTAFLIWITLIVIVTPVMLAVSKKAGVIIAIDAVYAIAAAAAALLRKRRIMKDILPVAAGGESMEKIVVNDKEVLERLRGEDALTMGLELEPDAAFYNLVYNWLNGLHGLKDGKLKLYLLRGALFNQICNSRIGNDVHVVCISMADLDIGAANERQFAREYGIFGRYLSDLIACADEE